MNAHRATISMPLDYEKKKNNITFNVLHDPLPWWKKQERRFPLVAALARKVLAIPATSAQSERLFSAACDQEAGLAGKCENLELLLLFLRKIVTDALD